MNQKNLTIIGLTILAVLIFSIVFPFWFYIAKIVIAVAILAVLIFSIVFPFWFYIAKIVIAVAIVIYFAIILRKKFKNDAIG